MKPDPAYLRQHYGSLTDEALLEIDRSDLVEIARKVYDAEISRRGLDRPRPARAVAVEPGGDPVEESELLDIEETPDWLPDGAEVYSVVDHPGWHSEERVANAQAALKAARIPSWAEMVEITPEERAPEVNTHRWRVVVPWQQSFLAGNVLDREFSNSDFEAGWRAHLEACSDHELPAMNPKVVFCSLIDRIERVTKVWEEEIARRGGRD